MGFYEKLNSIFEIEQQAFFDFYKKVVTSFSLLFNFQIFLIQI
jgi:hypothetical protein